MKERRAEYRKPVRLSVPGVYVYTPGISLVCWISGYLFSVGYPVYGEVSATPLWNTICRILPDKTITYLIGLVLTAGGALLIQRANYVLGLVREKTFLPFVLYILLISTNIEFFPFKSTSVGIFCLILGLYFLFKSYHDPYSQENTYKTALLIATGSLLWVHILWFFPLFWYGMYKFKCLNLRAILASLLGFLTVYWFLLGWCVWKQDFSFLAFSFTTLWKMQLLDFSQGDPTGWITILLVALFITCAAVYILTHEHEEALRTRQYLSFLMVFTVCSFLLFFLYGQSSEEFLIAACVPASILLAHFFAVNKNRFVFWGYHLFVIMLGLIILGSLWSSGSY